MGWHGARQRWQCANHDDSLGSVALLPPCMLSWFVYRILQVPDLVILSPPIQNVTLGDAGTLSACHVEKDMSMSTRWWIHVQEGDKSSTKAHHRLSWDADIAELSCLNLAICLPCLCGLPNLGVPPTYPTMGPMAAICGSGTSWWELCTSSKSMTRPSPWPWAVMARWISMSFSSAYIFTCAQAISLSLAPPKVVLMSHGHCHVSTIAMY